MERVAVMERSIYHENVAQTSFSASVKVKNELIFSQTEAVSSDVNGDEALLIVAGISSEPADGWPVSTRESNRQSFHHKIFE